MALIYLASTVLLKHFITGQYLNIRFDIKIQICNFSWKIRSSGSTELGLLPGNGGEGSLQNKQKSLPSRSWRSGGEGEREGALNKASYDAYIETGEVRPSRAYRPLKAAVPNLFATRNWFRGRQFFHRRWGEWFQDDSTTLHLRCTLFLLLLPCNI